MPGKLRIAYFAHSLRSDWNNGNAHFLRGLMRALGAIGHQVTIFESQTEWSIENLHLEALGQHSLDIFAMVYTDLDIRTYANTDLAEEWQEQLDGVDLVILHEWNPPALAQTLLALRDRTGFKLLFHDTHHRASSSPEQIGLFGLDQFDGILAFGEALRTIYMENFRFSRVWTLHEAADTTVFHPLANHTKITDVVWIGNWGEGERSEEIAEFLLRPAEALAREAKFTVYGVRYPDDGLRALAAARVRYAGYLPNLDAPAVYAAAGLTVHIPRQQYTQNAATPAAMTGIPTIRVFEALACGIPLISAPWQDTEALFRDGDLLFVRNAAETQAAMRRFLREPEAAAEQAQRGRETILARHTCDHRAQELTQIFEGLRQ